MGKSIFQVIHKEVFQGARVGIPVSKIIDIEGLEVTDLIEIRSYTSNVMGAASTELIVTRLVEIEDAPLPNKEDFDPEVTKGVIEDFSNLKERSETQEIIARFLDLASFNQHSVIRSMNFPKTEGNTYMILRDFMIYVKDNNYILWLRDCMDELINGESFLQTTNRVTRNYLSLGTNHRDYIAAFVSYKGKREDDKDFDERVIKYIASNLYWSVVDEKIKKLNSGKYVPQDR